MLFSNAFRVTPVQDDDWFDTILDVDTQLFVDPFLIFKETTGCWTTAHQKIIDHFEQAFLLIASNSSPTSLAYKKASAMVWFKEPREMCLGYTDKGTSGAGSGKGFARLIAKHMATAIANGLGKIEHFEEVSIFHKGIGPDRLSDAMCTILKPELVRYTQAIAKRHGLKLDQHRLYGGVFDTRRQRFEPRAAAEVLTNPVNGRPLVLVPKRFLRDLPTLNPGEWFDDYQAGMLRDDLSYEILKNVRKERIVDTARSRMTAVRQWLRDQEQRPPRPYDAQADPRGILSWEPAANAFTRANPLVVAPPDDRAEFEAVIQTIVERFKLYLEQQGGWSLLWDRTKDKPEDAAQLLFYGIARNYCEANNIVVSREVELGRGPVDFTFSNGFTDRAHLEAKKTHNGAFWNGLDLQLPSYMESDAVNLAWFMAIRYRNGKQWDQRDLELPRRVREAAKAHGRDLRLTLIDARKPVSASKIKPAKKMTP